MWPKVADDFFIGIAFFDVGNCGLDIFFPLFQIRTGDVEHGIGVAALI